MCSVFKSVYCKKKVRQVIIVSYIAHVAIITPTSLTICKRIAC